MNVLWLAAFPHPIKFQMHPAPWLTTLAQMLVSKFNIKLTVLTYNEHIEEDEIFDYDNIHFIVLKVNKDKLSLLKAYKDRINKLNAYLRSIAKDYDLIHVHGSEQLYQVAGASVNKPKVISIQGIINECVKILPLSIDYRHLSWRVASYYENKYLPYFTNFICRTEWDQNYIKNKIPDAIIHKNWELMRRCFYEASISSTFESKQLVFAGGVDFTKGVREAIKSFEIISETKDFNLVVAGAGSKSAFKHILDQLKIPESISKRIKFIGFLKAEELRNLYSESLCLIHPSYIDNSPNTVCEAQLTGLPVIAANVGGVSSLIEHLQTGMLTSHSPTEIAERIIQLCDNEDLHIRISQQSRKLALERHNPETIAKNTIKIYQEVIKQ